MKNIPDNWIETPIKSIAKVITGKTPPTNIAENYGKDIPFITPGDLGNTKYVYSTEKYITHKGAKGITILPPNTCLFTCIGSTIGKMGLTVDESITNQQLNAILANSDTDKEFLYYILSFIAPKIKKIAGVQAVPIINKTEFENTKISIPANEVEQRAIADILSTWDTAIEKMETLIEAKEKRFKAKSEIFITEIETSHKDILLGDICEIFTASSKSSEIVQTGKYVIADMGAISGKGELLDRKRSNNNKDLLNIGDLIMPKDDIGGGNIIGKVAYVSIDSVVLGDHVYALRFKENVNSKFIYYQINGQRINRQLRRMSNGTSQLGLGKKDVKKQKIYLPDIDEQNKVVEILDNIKKEITLIEQIKEYYKAQKRGLMQKLLTGEWRVKV